MSALNQNEIDLVIKTYDDVVSLVTSNLVGKELAHVMSFHNTTVLTLSPWQLSNKNVIDMLSSDIFNNEEIRNYVLNVYTMLMFKLGGGEEFKKRLIESFSNTALTETKSNINDTFIPQELHSYMVPKETAARHLTTDAWMIVIMLMFYIGLKKVVDENT